MTLLRRRSVRVLLTLLAAYVLLGLAGAVAFIELSLRLPKRPLTAGEIAIAQARAAQVKARIEEVEIVSKDNLRLPAQFAKHPGS